MTTKLTYTKHTYQIRSVINYDELEFNPDEPEPYDMFQYPTLQEILHVLDSHITGLYPSEDVFRSSNTFICYDQSNLNVRVAPDFYVAFGVDAPAIEARKIYLPWEAGKPPDLALEVASESTSGRDINFKRRLYAQIGIAEYWRFDRSGGDFYGQPLAGDRLENGVYQPIELTNEPDGVLKGYSPAMQASLCWQEGSLKFYLPEVGQYLRNLPESEDALRQAEEGWARERAAFDQERAARERERERREASDARIRELEEELGRRRGEG